MNSQHQAINQSIDERSRSVLINANEQILASMLDLFRGMTPGQLHEAAVGFDEVRKHYAGCNPGLGMLLALGTVKFAEVFEQLIAEAREGNDADAA